MKRKEEVFASWCLALTFLGVGIMVGVMVNGGVCMVYTNFY